MNGPQRGSAPPASPAPAPDPANTVAAEWGGSAVPPAWVLARIAEEAELQGLGEARLADACRLLRALLRDAQRQAEAMASALGAVTHDFAANRHRPAVCGVKKPGGFYWPCSLRADHPVHRTPSVVLSGLDAEATP